MGNKRILQHKYTIIFFICVVLGAILFFYRAPFSTGGWDEPFYLSVAHRLTLGDALLSEEWHVSQLSGFILYPIMKIYMALTGTTAGIVLSFRYIYIVFHIVGTICIYRCLRKWELAGLLASLYYLFYIPNNVMNFSYNAIGLFGTMFSLVLMAVSLNSAAWKYVTAGIFFAIGVLACPFNVLMYLLYVLIVCVVAGAKKSKSAGKWIDKVNNLGVSGLQLRAFLYFTVGAVIVAVVFMVFVLNRDSISEVFENLPHIL